MERLMLRDGSPQEAGMDPARIQRVRDLLAACVARGDTPSVVACVARRGIVVLHEAYGVRHYADTGPTLRRDAIFPLASCSKPLAASVIMCLVDDGLIGLNRPFIDYLPELDRPDVEGLAEATVSDLLTHTAGIDDLAWSGFIQAGDRWASADPPPVPGRHPVTNRIIHLAAGAPLARRDGAMMYSSFGYLLLGDIVRAASGQPFWQFARARLFEPLGMRGTGFVLRPELRDRRVYRKPGMPGTAATTPWYWGIDSEEFDTMDWGGSGATSTAIDLAVFMQMLLNDGEYGGRRVLSRASVAAMTRSQVGTNVAWVMPRLDAATGKRNDIEATRGGYGYGLAIVGVGSDRWRPNGSLASPSTFAHSGFGCAYVWADPEQDLLGIFLSAASRMHRGIPFLNSDLFQNAVHAAIVD
jgi:CubicO group peptidase (beta-lactamase class C family)